MAVTLLAEGLIDEIIITLNPVVFGVIIVLPILLLILLKLHQSHRENFQTPTAAG
ncbi:MAG: hypothetical protein SF097_14020 [Acidobacteriota bacterium]|nr:hypothetical protein [Acidobacteriota bacterium]